MPLYTRIYILSLVLICCLQPLVAQHLDSLMADRELKMQDYSHFKDTMKARTWVNLVDLGRRAEAVIDADNELVNIHLQTEYKRTLELRDLNDKLNLELAMLENDNNKKRLQLGEYQQLNNILLVVIFGLASGLVLSLVFLGRLYRKNRQATYELERLWSMNDDQSIALREREKNLEKQIRLLEIENKSMHKEFMLIADQKSDTKRKLEKEIDSRLKVEREIKDLLGQIKKQ